MAASKSVTVYGRVN